jgi:hypothetical protein
MPKPKAKAKAMAKPKAKAMAKPKAKAMAKPKAKAMAKPKAKAMAKPKAKAEPKPKAKAKTKVSIGCKASKDGRVTVMLLKNGVAEAGVGMPGQDVAGVVAMLLAAAMDAARMSGQAPFAGSSVSLGGAPMIVPTAIGLSQGETSEPMALVVHAGTTRFGIALSKPRELAHALWTASAPRSFP